MQSVAFEITRLKEKEEKGLRAKSTITKWESTRTKLEAFLLHKYKKADIPMEIIRPNFAEDLLHYFMVEQELDHNTAMKYIRNTKQVLTTAAGRWIQINRVKTGNPEDVPLLPIPEAIIEKYKDDKRCHHSNRLLPVNSNVKYNAYLKELADLCGISKKLTTHIARHTFATTVTLENDVPIETVSKMLGHRSIRTTQIYARITKKKISNDMKALRKKLFYGGKLNVEGGEGDTTGIAI